MHRRAAVSLGQLLLFVCFLTGCGSPPQLPMTYPFVEVLLEPPPAAGTQVQVNATFNGKSRSETFLDNDMLSRITISLPPEGRGNLEMLVTVRDANRCIVATARTELMVTANEVRTLTVNLMAQLPPLCPMGPPVPITVQKTGDGKGEIVATPDSLSCDAGCQTKMASFESGTVVTLAATADPGGAGTRYTFDGWSGACTGTGGCFITLAQAENVTARFTCHGWCPENLPGVTSNLNGLYGFASNRLVAVGDGGIILQWNGSGWTRLTSSITTNNLRGISGFNGTLGFAVGDAGTILRTTDGGTGWAVLPAVAAVQLRSVWIASMTEAYAVGDKINNNYPWLIYDGTTWGNPGLGGLDHAWNSAYGVGPGQYYIVGASGRAVVSVPLLNATNVDGAPELRGIFGLSHLTMTAVGGGGTIVRYMPATRTWSSMNRLSAASPNLRAIHGTGPTRMVTVGEGGTVWTYDGNTWSVEQTPMTTQLNAVFLISNEEIFVVGQGGLIYHKRP